MKNRKMFFGCIVLFILMAGCLWLTFPAVRIFGLLLANSPTYIRFIREANDISSKFDALNEETYYHLPTPYNGAVEQKRQVQGNGSFATKYGRELDIEYQLKETAPLEVVIDYYKNQRSPKKWVYYTKNGYYGLFIQDTTCMKIDRVSFVYPKDPGAHYYLYIWHDFFEQDFSPSFPDFPTINGNPKSNIFIWYTLGEVKFLTCPPDRFKPPVK